MGQLAGVGTETLYRAGRDTTFGSCTIDTLSKIARALGVDVKDLFIETKDE